MDKRISLCIPYVYHRFGGAEAPKKSLFRIADYIDGTLNPIDFQTDDSINNPKFVRFIDELELYKPVLRTWWFRQDAGTESSKYKVGSLFYEVVIDKKYINPNPREVQKAIREGIDLPKGCADNFLLVIDLDDENYYALKCSLKMLRSSGNKRYFEKNLSDIEHCIHYLEQYVIPRTSVFSTESHKFYTEEDKLAPVRYFYNREELPDMDGIFYLHEFSDYISVFIGRYLKNNDKNYSFTKGQISSIREALAKALSSQDELRSFYEKSGYDYDYVEKNLPQYEEMMTKEFLGSDKLDDIILNILLKNEEVCSRFEAVAEKKWLSNANEKKEELESTINLLEKDIETNQQLIVQKEKRIEKLESDVMKLEDNSKALSKITKQILIDFDSDVSTRIAESIVLNSINRNDVTTSDDDYEVHLFDSPEDVKSTEDVSLAERVLARNLRTQGFDSDIATLLGRLVLTKGNYHHHYVVSGTVSKRFADAISNSIDGSDAAIANIFSSKPNLKKILCDMRGIQANVILINGVLDNCVENLYFSLCRALADKILVFSLDAVENISILSKSIWDYSIFINHDVYYNNRIQRSEEIVKQRIDYKGILCDMTIENEFLIPMIKESFVKCGLGFAAIEQMLRIFTYIVDNKILDEDRIKLFISSILVRFISAYKKGMSETTFEQIVGILDDDIKVKYLF